MEYLERIPLPDHPTEVSVLNIPSMNALDEVSDELSPFVFQTKTELLEIAKMLEKYPNIHIIADEIYEHINFTRRRKY